jgi:hypothetical protein
MTHDELIKDLDACIEGAEYGPYEWGFKALRAIAELHKPLKDPFYGDMVCHCGVVGDTHYPCPTIKIIEKELSDD